MIFALFNIAVHKHGKSIIVIAAVERICACRVSFASHGQEICDLPYTAPFCGNLYIFVFAVDKPGVKNDTEISFVLFVIIGRITFCHIHDGSFLRGI